MTPSDVYTFTLASQVYTVSVEANSGDIFLTKVFLSLTAIFVLDVVFILIYQR